MVELRGRSGLPGGARKITSEMEKLSFCTERISSACLCTKGDGFRAPRAARPGRSAQPSQAWPAGSRASVRAIGVSMVGSQVENESRCLSVRWPFLVSSVGQVVVRVLSLRGDSAEGSSWPGVAPGGGASGLVGRQSW